MWVPSARAARSLYVANGFSESVSAFTVGSNGSLTPVPGSPIEVGYGPVGVAITPDARHLYVTNLESNFISAFTIGLNGGLTPVPGSPFPSLIGGWGVAVSPDGAHLYVAHFDSSKVSAYSIGADGSLTALSTPVSTGGSHTNGVAVTPDGKFLYATNMDSNNVSAFSIAADGSLTAVPGSPFESGATARPIEITPDGKYMYVGTTDNDIWGYSIGSDGALGPLASSPFVTPGGQSLGLAITPDGGHLYGTHVGGGDNVWGYSIGSDGGLSTLAGSPFPTGSWRGNSATVSPDGKHLYATNSGFSNISVYSIAGNGALSAIAGSPFAAGGDAPLQVATTPDQGPKAAFSVSPEPAGNALPFDASASSDVDGSVTSYHWDFGDGQSQVGTTPRLTHVYEAAGDYTVTLTVTDDAGCSTAQVFTGQTVGCNGSPLARVSHPLTVPPGKPLSVSLSGSGSGSVTSEPAGVGCPGVCTYFFEPGSDVTLIPNPSSGSAFGGWSGGGCSGTGKCEVTVSSETEVTATFDELPPPPPPPFESPSAVEPGLRIGRIGGTPRSACGARLVLAPRPLGGHCAKPKITVSGGIAKAAGGAVRVKVSAHLRGRRVAVGRWAQIREGHWHARVPFPWAKLNPHSTVLVAVRFGGSPGVQSGLATRRARVIPST